MTGGRDDGTEVRDITDEEMALIMAVEVPDDPGDVCGRLREFANRYPEVEADLVSGPDDGGDPRGVTVVVRDGARPYTTDRIHVLRELEPVRHPTGHVEDVPSGPGDDLASP